jgi:hypothetical protein
VDPPEEGVPEKPVDYSSSMAYESTEFYAMATDTFLVPEACETTSSTTCATTCATAGSTAGAIPGTTPGTVTGATAYQLYFKIQDIVGGTNVMTRAVNRL